VQESARPRGYFGFPPELFAHLDHMI